MRKFFIAHPEYSYDPDTGEIFGKNGRVMKTMGIGNGYLSINFYEDGKQKMYYVHRLICEAEHPNPDNLATVDHIDRNKLNNSAENLRWMSQSENARLGNLGNKSMLGKHHSEETKRKISKATKGKKLPPRSEEWRMKNSENKKGNKNMLGKHHSDDTKLKMSEARKKYWQNKKSKESDTKNV